MLTNKKATADKLRQVLINDKHIKPQYIQDVLKNDIYAVLVNYFDIKPDDIILKISVEDDSYVLRCKTYSKRLKLLGIMPNEG